MCIANLCRLAALSACCDLSVFQVPLLDYHGGGEAAAFDPMSAHLPEFEMVLAQVRRFSGPFVLDAITFTHRINPRLNLQNLGAGVSACYRGDRFYDAPSAQAVVTKWATICRSPPYY